MSRRFQFSLRALLVVMTATCVFLGWIVERSHRRGAAVDAIVKGRSVVSYGDDVLLSEFLDINHFWLDIKQVPIRISLDPAVQLDAALGEQLTKAIPIEFLTIANVRDDELRHLKGLNKGCSLVLFSTQKLSDEAITDLKRRMPNVILTNVDGAIIR